MQRINKEIHDEPQLVVDQENSELRKQLDLIKSSPKCLHLPHNSSLDSCINHHGYVFLQVIDIHLMDLTES